MSEQEVASTRPVLSNLYLQATLAFLLFFPAVLAPTSALRKMAADSEVRCLPPTYRCLCLS